MEDHSILFPGTATRSKKNLQPNKKTRRVAFPSAVPQPSFLSPQWEWTTWCITSAKPCSCLASDSCAQHMPFLKAVAMSKRLKKKKISTQQQYEWARSSVLILCPVHPIHIAFVSLGKVSHLGSWVMAALHKPPTQLNTFKQPQYRTGLLKFSVLSGKRKKRSQTELGRLQMKGLHFALSEPLCPTSAGQLWTS